MIREYLGKKAAETIDRSKYGDSKVGRITSTILDEDRLEAMGHHGFSSIGEDLNEPHLRYRMLGLGLAANVISWLAVFLFPSLVSNLVVAITLIFSKGWVLLVVPVFGFTIIGVYSLLRTWFPERDGAAQAGEVMQSYQYQSDSLVTWKLWVAASGAAGVDAILLIVTYLENTGGWQ